MTAEHNMEEAYITKWFNNWKKALEAFVQGRRNGFQSGGGMAPRSPPSVTGLVVDHQQSKTHRAAITYESVVP